MFKTRLWVLTLPLLLGAQDSGLDRTAHAQKFRPGTLVVSRVQYDGNTFGNSTPFPDIFADKTVSGIEASVHLDGFYPINGFPSAGTMKVRGVTSNFAGRLEGVLTLSVDGRFLTYIGIAAPVGSNGTSTSYSTSPGVNLQGNTSPLFNRVIAMVAADGSVTLNPVDNAYSGDVPRAAITVDGTQFYMVGNADSTIYDDGTGPGTTIGARYTTIGSATTIQLANYFANDRPDETAVNHVKDNNFRGLAIFKGNLYVSKGSGGNGDNGLFRIFNGTSGDGLPVSSGNSVSQLFGSPATDPVSKTTSVHTPYGFWFGNDTTVYVADEGNVTTDAKGALVVDPLAGLEKWINVNGTWKLAYTLQMGLKLGQPETVDGYPVPTATYGLRNLTGQVNLDGTVTIYAVTAQYSSMSNGTPDPNKIVSITDVLSATTLPTFPVTDFRATAYENFTTLRVAKPGQAYRGIAFAPVKKKLQ